MRTLFLPALLLPLGLAGCGDGVNCSFTACGGSPIGEWRVSGACGSTSMGIPNCSGATVSAEVTSASGNVSLVADMTYSSSVMTAGTFSARIPGSCLSGVTSCDQIAQMLQNNGLPGASCSGNPSSSCSCSGQVSSSDSETGTWSVAGDQLTIQQSGSSSSDTATFCQQGSTLKIQSSAGTVLVLSR